MKRGWDSAGVDWRTLELFFFPSRPGEEKIREINQRQRELKKKRGTELKNVPSGVEHATTVKTNKGGDR